MSISSVNFGQIEFFYFSKFVYNFCKNFFLKLLFGVNEFYYGTNLSNTSGGSPTMLIRLRTLLKLLFYVNPAHLRVFMRQLSVA